MAILLFWVPAGFARLHPSEISILGQAKPAQRNSPRGGEFTAHLRRALPALPHSPNGRYFLSNARIYSNIWDIDETNRDLPTILLGHFAGKGLRTPARSGKIMSQNGRFFAMPHLLPTK